jgi:hypothetical protein
MRKPTLLLTAAAAALLTVAAMAQDPAPPAEAPAKGLSDLGATVEGLQDEPATGVLPAETPPPPEPAAEAPPTEAPPAETPPVETAPAPEPAAEAPPTAEAPPAETPPAGTPPAPEPAATPAPTPPAAPSSRPPEPLTRAQRDQLAADAQRGRLLGAIAAAGQIATRDMLSRIADPEAAGIAGWIAEPEGNGVAVTFYAEGADGAPPSAVFKANVLGGRVVSREVFLAGTRPPLGPLQARMAAARRAASGQDHRPCGGDQFNYLVVPPTTADGPIDVYQISPQMARGRLPVGGHFKTTVAADNSIVSTRGFTNRCLDAEVPEAVAGTRPPPLAVTHLLDPLPTEIHVLLSILAARPLLVVADDPQRLFAVTPEGIAEVPR